MSDKLTVKWSKKEKDLIIHYPSRPDGALAHSAFCSEQHHPFDDTWSKSFVEELKSRGYDITTLKFSIQKLKDNGQGT